MNDLHKLSSALQYITECKWTRKTVDCFGDNLAIGCDLPTINIIRDLSIIIGKAQVYQDKGEIQNYNYMCDAFWKIFEEEDFDKNDFEDWINTFHEEDSKL